jgi:hypothetical protein
VQHVDPEDLGLMALGEEPDAALAAHLADCGPCLAELEELRSAVRIGRDAASDGSLVQPPAGAWAAIHHELGLRTVSAVLEAQAPPITTSATAPRAVRPLRPRSAPRRRGFAVLALAAAAVLALVAGVLLPRVLAPQRPEVIAQARLAALPGWTGASGSATLERLPDGHRTLRLRLETPAIGRDYREVWLIDPRTKALVSLGIVDRTTGTFAVPNDLDLTSYDLVDVSNERPDGNPAHSGDSIVRGTLNS